MDIEALDGAWTAVLDLLGAQLLELTGEDPDPARLDALHDQIEALAPRLAQPPPPGQAATWASHAQEAERLARAVAEAATARRDDLARRQAEDGRRLRGVAAYGKPDADDPRFLDQRR